jgi:hypothetical protein
VLSLTFLPCIIRRSRRNQHNALVCTTPLFYILAPTCFGSSLPSSGIFLDLSELLEIQIEWVVYNIMCGYVACVPECRGPRVGDHDTRTLIELKTAITTFIRNISQADLQKVFANRIKRVQACIDARGYHFQHFSKCTATFRTHCVKLKM